MAIIASGVGLMITLILIEIFFLKRIKKEDIPWEEITMNINSGHIVMWLFRGVEGFLFYLVYKYFSLDLFASWNYISLWITAFILWDFSYYWSHRSHHTFKFLWSVHVVHHQGEHFSLSLAFRNSWFSTLTSFVFFAWLAVIGIPLEVFISVAALNYFVQFYNHNAITRKSGWLEYIFVTPHHHKVHHGIHKEYLNKNCGGTLIIWDKLFGTFQEHISGVEMKYGLSDAKPEYNPFWGNLEPFLKYFKLSKWIRRKENKNKAVVSPIYIFSSTMALFFVFMIFIYYKDVWDMSQLTSHFLLVLLGTIALGSIAHGSSNGLKLWIIISSFFMGVYVVWFEIYQSPILLSLCLLLALHGLFGLKEIKAQKNIDNEIFTNSSSSIKLKKNEQIQNKEYFEILTRRTYIRDRIRTKSGNA